MHLSLKSLRRHSARAAALAFALLLAFSSVGQKIRHATHITPTGKGWGVESDNAPDEQATGRAGTTSGYGIAYHGGPVMSGAPVAVYFIWYGNWTSGPRNSDSSGTRVLLDTLFGSNGLNGSAYEDINTTYSLSSSPISGQLVVAPTEAYDNYSHGRRLSDLGVEAVVANAINTHQLPKDPNGLYFVLTSSDVNETSGFCTRYCGWHTHASIGGVDIKYSFVGNPDRCPNACEWQTVSPNGNSGADGMASIMAHESEEAISDPDLNAWYDSNGNENADKCAWQFGPVSRTSTGAEYNQTLAQKNWLIQMNWLNTAPSGGCAQSVSGPFYSGTTVH